MAKLERIYESEVRALIDTMWSVAAKGQGISIDEARNRYEMRQLMAEDWDGMTESDYSYDWSTDGDQNTSGARFTMEPIDRFEVVGVYGWMNGNCSTTINHIEVWKNNSKKREWFGQQLAAEENDKTIFMDPIYAIKSEILKVIPNTTGAAATSKAFPMGFVIKPQS